MQTDVYIKIINEKMNMEFWMAGFLVIPKVYAVIASPFTYLTFPGKTRKLRKIKSFCICIIVFARFSLVGLFVERIQIFDINVI